MYQAAACLFDHYTFCPIHIIQPQTCPDLCTARCAYTTKQLIHVWFKSVYCLKFVSAVAQTKVLQSVLQTSRQVEAIQTTTVADLQMSLCSGPRMGVVVVGSGGSRWAVAAALAVLTAVDAVAHYAFAATSLPSMLKLSHNQIQFFQAGFALPPMLL